MNALGETVLLDLLRAGLPLAFSASVRPSLRSLRSRRKAHTLKQEPGRHKDTGPAWHRLAAGGLGDATESSTKQRERWRGKQRELLQRPGGPGFQRLDPNGSKELLQTFQEEKHPNLQSRVSRQKVPTGLIPSEWRWGRTCPSETSEHRSEGFLGGGGEA